MNKITSIIDSSINKYLEIDGDYQKKIFESMNYSLFSGGKRLRPIFMIKAFELFNKDLDQILPYAIAIEMIHTYSLVHDDLPSMDDDDFRRDKPTNHKVYGEAMAILAGDGLLNKAYEIMMEDILKSSLENHDISSRIRAASLIARSAGVEGMIGGQVVDISSDQDNIDKDKLMFMYESKTAALFKASILAGGIIGGAKEEELEILDKYACLLGLSYQIQDDLLDMEEDNEIGKTTYLTFYNKDKAEKDLDSFNDECVSLLDSLNKEDTSFLKELTNMLTNRKK